jgi:cytochrome c oxidase cbb3-type subunit III
MRHAMKNSASRSRMRALLGALMLCIATACEREARRLNEEPPKPPSVFVSQVNLQPGPTFISDTAEGPFDDNAHGTTEGQILFDQMNCSGCHANGGGGMGPPLMDDEWIYGSLPNQIFASIAEGRANGMPSWKYRLTTQQMWQLTAYVRSLSSLTPKSARPGRNDHMMVKPAPMQTPTAKPKNTALPGAAQRP